MVSQLLFVAHNLDMNHVDVMLFGTCTGTVLDFDSFCMTRRSVNFQILSRLSELCFFDRGIPSFQQFYSLSEGRLLAESPNLYLWSPAIPYNLTIYYKKLTSYLTFQQQQGDKDRVARLLPRRSTQQHALLCLMVHR